MIPPLVYASSIQSDLVEDTASKLGTKASSSQEFSHQPHLYLSEAGLSFFHGSFEASSSQSS